MKKKSMLIVAIILMSIGFASISTTLILNGNAKVSENTDDFSVIFTAATLDGTDVYSTVVDSTKKIITFEISELKTLNQTSVLNYEVTNNSANYDAEVKVTCVPSTGTTAKYTSIKNKLENDATVVKAKSSVNGTLTITLDKTSTESVTEEYTCKLEFTATERETLAVGATNLYNLIETNADKKTTIDYKVRSGVSGTNGIYTTTQTEGNTPVYYFRGDADKVNNNIIFNNMCWKIIRTTETGGVKIIYNGTPADGKCETQTGASTQIGTSKFNTNYDDNAYVGYMYGTPGSTTYAATHANTNDSTIKTYIDNWYKANFDETTTSKLEDTIFCNDRRTTEGGNNNILKSNYGTLGYGQNGTGYASIERTSSDTLVPKPDLTCYNENDGFSVDSSPTGNRKLVYSVGLITLDEAILAGFNTYASSNNDYMDTTNYLYSESTFWTMSPIYFRTNEAARIGIIDANGNIGNHPAYYLNGVRPVVSLKNNTLVSLGRDGTSTNPYVVE